MRKLAYLGKNMYKGSMMRKGLSPDLADLVELVFTFPKQSTNDENPEPLAAKLTPNEIKGLSMGEGASPLDFPFLGNDRAHFAVLQRFVRNKLAKQFHAPDSDFLEETPLDLPEASVVYVARADAEARLSLLLEQPQIIKLLGTTGSGKTTLISRMIHEKKYSFLYLNCASKTFNIFQGTSCQHPKYTDDEVPEDQLTTIRANLSTILAERLVSRVGLEPLGKRIDPAELIDLIKPHKNKNNFVVVFDDLDAMPLMVQAAVFQFAVDIFRAIKVPVVLGQRMSNAARLIREGAFADPVEEVRLSPNGLEPSLDEYCLEPSELVRIYRQRMNVLARSGQIDKYFKKWHAPTYELYFSRGALARLGNIPEIHIKYLVEKCDLYDSCNHSIRGATHVLANIVKQILLEEKDHIRPDEILRGESNDRLHLRLRDCLLEELFAPTTGTPSLPRVIEPAGRKISASIELRALELLHFSGGHDGSEVAFPTWVQFVSACFPEVQSQRVEEILRDLTSKPFFGDPLCVRTAGPIERSDLTIMPAGRHFVVRLASSVDFLSRSYAQRIGVLPYEDPAERVRKAFDVIELLQQEWLDEDRSRLEELSAEFSPVKRLLKNHFLIRCLRGLQAYVPNMGDVFATRGEKTAWLQKTYRLEHEVANRIGFFN